MWPGLICGGLRHNPHSERITRLIYYKNLIGLMRHRGRETGTPWARKRGN